MNWFPFLSKKKVDDDILELYFEIELLTHEIDRELTQFVRYQYLPYIQKLREKTNKQHSIEKVCWIFRQLKREFGDCFAVRENKKKYNFKYAKDIAEKERIITEQKKIKKILERIAFEIKELRNAPDIKEASLEEFVLELETVFMKQKRFTNMINSDKNDLIELMESIYIDSERNKKNMVWLADQNNKSKALFFSCDLPMDKLRRLELLPLLNDKDVTLRSSFIFGLHKDKILPLYHYNLGYKGRNIHVLPSFYKNKLKSFICQRTA